jgi:thymidylate synthase (FAD)
VSVKLIVATPDAEKLILFIARVSSDQENDSPKLLDYLIRNGHWSPFEHAHMTLEIITSRAIGTQILRHRSFTFQEFSQRYATVDDIDGAILHPLRVKASEAATNRQGSVDSDNQDLATWWDMAQREAIQSTFILYEEAISLGIAPELARMLLPLSTRTKIYMTGTLRSWIHYLGDGPGGRTNEHTQKEHKDLALQGKAIFCEQFPIISEALGWTDAGQ